MPFRLSRSAALVSLVAFVAVACPGGNGDDDGSSGSASSIAALKEGADGEMSLIQAQSVLSVGENTFTFGLSNSSGGLIAGGAPAVYVAQNENAEVTGPVPARWLLFTGYEKTHDHSPRSPLPGFYEADLDIPKTGTWMITAVAENEGRTLVGTAVMRAPEKVVAPIGSKAVAVDTPVATKGVELKQICTREPPDPLHYISLRDALRNGKPTVVTFATPLLCESQLCGPVVDEVLLVYRDIGPSRANFVHVEEFLRNKDLELPIAVARNQSAPFKAWALHTEPWTFVIDAEGIIRARFGEGPVVASQIETALRPLL